MISRHDAKRMQPVTSILVVLDRGEGDLPLLTKAITLARAFGASLELYSCDAEHEYTLRHSYDAHGLAAARRARNQELCRYLKSLSERVAAEKLTVSIDVISETPLYEGIVRKVIASHPGLVMKSAVHEPSLRRSALGANDWQLVRTCPAPLMFGRGRTWHAPPHFAAAVDVSEAETPGLGAVILHTAALLRARCGGELDVLFGERPEASAQDREAHAASLRKLAVDEHLEAQRIRSVTGDPAVTLTASAAEQRYDALVLGALAHRPQHTALVGTLTSQLMEALDSDFILVRGEHFVSPVHAADREKRSMPARKDA
jgi:universal stress protein E